MLKRSQNWCLVWPKESFSLGSNLTIFEEVVSLSIQVLSANFNWIHYNLVQIFPILIILLLAAGYLSTYQRILWTSLLFTIFSFQMGFTGNLATLEADGLYEQYLMMLLFYYLQGWLGHWCWYKCRSPSSRWTRRWSPVRSPR